MPDELQDKIEQLMGKPVAAAAPAPADDNIDPMWHWGPRFRTPGMRPPPSGSFDLPPVEGSASDIGRSHMGCAAQRQEEWK